MGIFREITKQKQFQDTAINDWRSRILINDGTIDTFGESSDLNSFKYSQQEIIKLEEYLDELFSSETGEAILLGFEENNRLIPNKGGKILINKMKLDNAYAHFSYNAINLDFDKFFRNRVQDSIPEAIAHEFGHGLNDKSLYLSNKELRRFKKDLKKEVKNIKNEDLKESLKNKLHQIDDLVDYVTVEDEEKLNKVYESFFQLIDESSLSTLKKEEVLKNFYVSYPGSLIGRNSMQDENSATITQNAYLISSGKQESGYYIIPQNNAQKQALDILNKKGNNVLNSVKEFESIFEDNIITKEEKLLLKQIVKSLKKNGLKLNFDLRGNEKSISLKGLYYKDLSNMGIER